MATAAEIFTRPGVYFYALGSNNTDRVKILDWAKNAEFGWAVVQCFDHTTLIEQTNIAAWRDDIRLRGMYFGVWGVQRTDPSGDASRADSQIDTWGADFYIANAEADYKTDTGGVRENAATFCTAFRAAQPTIPAALVTYGTTSNDYGLLGDALVTSAGVMDFKAWFDADFHIMPEAYYGANTIYKPDRCVRHYRRANFPLNKIHPVIGIYVGGNSTTGAQYRDLLAQLDNFEAEIAFKTDVPKAMWKFMESTGSIFDTSGNSLDLTTITGTPDYNQEGAWVASPSVRLQGGEFIDRSVPVSTVTNNLTMEMYVHVEDIGQNQQEIMYNGVNTTNGCGIVVSVDRTWSYLVGNIAYGTLAQSLMPNRFAHIVVVRRAGTWEYYIDGQLDTANAGTSAPVTPATRFRLGAGSVQTKYSYMAFYETALTSTRIKAHYDALKMVKPVCFVDTAYGFSLFLGEISGSLGAITEQDYIDLGIATKNNHVAVRTSAIPRISVRKTFAGGARW
jgi:hypothetical protein